MSLTNKQIQAAKDSSKVARDVIEELLSEIDDLKSDNSSLEQDVSDAEADAASESCRANELENELEEAKEELRTTQYDLALLRDNALTGIDERGDYTAAFQPHASAADVTHPLDDRHSLWPWNNE